MKTLKLLKLKLFNFMGIEDVQEFDLDGNVIISGRNADGKTTIPTSFMWLMFNCDMDMNDNPNIRCKGNEKDDVVVEAEMLIDGCRTVIEKRQKRKIKEVEKVVNGAIETVTTVSDTNTYSIDGEKLSLKDFNERLYGGDYKKYLICSNIDGFIAKQNAGMRTFLMDMVGNECVSDIDIVNSSESLSALKQERDKGYSLSAIESKAKTTITDKKKELLINEGIVKDIEKTIKEKQGIDVAELELERVDLKKRIELVDNASNVVLGIKNEILETRMAMNEVVRKNSEKDVAARNNLLSEYESIRVKLSNHETTLKFLDAELKSVESQLENAKADKDRLVKEWHDKKAQQFDESKCICPVCKRELPESEITSLKASFEKNKADLIAQIESDGFKAKSKVEEFTAKVGAVKLHIEETQVIVNDLKKALTDHEEKLKQFTGEPADLNNNEEYKVLAEKMRELEEKLQLCESSSENRQTLIVRLNEVERIISYTDTTKDEEKLEERTASLDALQTEILDAERIQKALKNFEILKCKAVEEVVNKMFEGVKFELFTPNKQGELKPCCEPLVDGMSILRMEANKAKRIYGKVAIVKGLQGAFGINIPVFIDDAESLDTENLKKTIAELECQKIVLKVSDDDLKIYKIGE